MRCELLNNKTSQRKVVSCVTPMSHLTFLNQLCIQHVAFQLVGSCVTGIIHTTTLLQNDCLGYIKIHFKVLFTKVTVNKVNISILQLLNNN